MTALFRSFATGPNAPRIESQSEIDRLYRSNRIRVMLAITIGYGLIYTCRLALGVVKKPLIDQGIFTPAELGTIGSALFYTYAIGKLTNGFLADHANMRRFLAASFLLTALCNLGMGFTTSLWAAILLWGLNGWFQSFGAPGGVVAMTAWFSNRERGRAYGIWSTAHSIGEGLTFFVVGSLVAWLGWQWGFWGPGLIGIITALGVFALLQDRPQTLGLPPVNEWKNDHYQEHAKDSARTTLALQFSVLKIPSIWVLALASATIYVTRYAINSWGILYLQEARGYSLPMAGTLLMVSTLAGIIGAVAYGFHIGQTLQCAAASGEPAVRNPRADRPAHHLLRPDQHADADPGHAAVRDGPHRPGHLARRAVRRRYRAQARCRRRNGRRSASSATSGRRCRNKSRVS